jgi:hypothetical protein
MPALLERLIAPILWLWYAVTRSLDTVLSDLPNVTMPVVATVELV